MTDDADRPFHPTDPGKVKPGDLLAVTFYVRVGAVHPPTPLSELRLETTDLANGKPLGISGERLVAGSLSADQFAETVELPITKLEKVFMASTDRPLTVVFVKKDQSERTLRGRRLGPSYMGYSKVEDLDLPADGPPRIREVDHRTLKQVVVDGVKYVRK